MLYIGADHGGFKLKQALVSRLQQAGLPVKDVGANRLNPADDYPLMAASLAALVARRPIHQGILLCRSGVGVNIVANKIRGIRAVLANDTWTAKRARRDENANILCLAAERLQPATAMRIIRAWMKQSPRGTVRDRRRLAQLSAIEREQ